MIQEETEKYNQILHSASYLFSKQGYKKTTVDEIVAKARISKGLFYHYFKNKQELYLYLYNTYVDILSHAVRDEVDINETDFFQRLKQITYIRIKFITAYPNLWKFLYSAYYEPHPDIESSIKEKNKLLLHQSYTTSASNIDWSQLKKGCSPDKAIELITWMAEGFMRKLEENATPLNEALLDEFDEYLEYMKNGMFDTSKE